MFVSNMVFKYLQIRQYGRLEDGSLNVVTRGQQRFHLRRCWNDVDGVVRKILLHLLPFLLLSTCALVMQLKIDDSLFFVCWGRSS
jgi:Lon protease-like protein